MSAGNSAVVASSAVIDAATVWYFSLRRACRHPEVLSIGALADNGQKTLHAIITYDERMRTTGSARLECSDLIQCFVLARVVRKKDIDSGFRGDVLKTP